MTIFGSILAFLMVLVLALLIERRARGQPVTVLSGIENKLNFQDRDITGGDPKPLKIRRQQATSSSVMTGDQTIPDSGFVLAAGGLAA